MVCMAEEVNEMDDGLQTLVGNGGVRLIGRTGRTSGSCKNSFATKSQFWFWMILFRLWIRAPRDKIFCQFESTGEREYCAADFPPSVSVSADESDHLDGRWKNSGGYA